MGQDAEPFSAAAASTRPYDCAIVRPDTPASLGWRTYIAPAISRWDIAVCRVGSRGRALPGLGPNTVVDGLSSGGKGASCGQFLESR